jgi:hypothetical protein
VITGCYVQAKSFGDASFKLPRFREFSILKKGFGKKGEVITKKAGI